MQVKVMIFGQLTDIVKSSTLTLTGTADTRSLVDELKRQFPALGQAKYILAVDKQRVTENTILKDGSIVALLPPFSGG
jgi:molybdopterin synthase sulfur carrier subunit